MSLPTLLTTVYTIATGSNRTQLVDGVEPVRWCENRSYSLSFRGHSTQRVSANVDPQSSKNVSDDSFERVFARDRRGHAGPGGPRGGRLRLHPNQDRPGAAIALGTGVKTPVGYRQSPTQGYGVGDRPAARVRRRSLHSRSTARVTVMGSLALWEETTESVAGPLKGVDV
jgi:hypothetical protein